DADRPRAGDDHRRRNEGTDGAWHSAPRRPPVGPRGDRVCGVDGRDVRRQGLAAQLPRLDVELPDGPPRRPDTRRVRRPFDARGDLRRVARRDHDARALPGLRVNDADQELYELAVVASGRAYAPYSRFHVGAVVRTRDGHIYEGVNVENAAYPLGVCAERVAFSRAIADGCRPGDFEAIGITASPCGGCRQWLVEMKV